MRKEEEFSDHADSNTHKGNKVAKEKLWRFETWCLTPVGQLGLLSLEQRRSVRAEKSCSERRRDKRTGARDAQVFTAFDHLFEINILSALYY